MDKIGELIQFPSRRPISSIPRSQDHREAVAKRVSLMCGCFRRDDAADPVIYASALVAVMEDYPIEVVQHVTNPKTGLPRMLKFLPTVAEVADACEKAMDDRRKLQEPPRALGPMSRPTPINPHMWDDAKARARHEKKFTPND